MNSDYVSGKASLTTKQLKRLSPHMKKRTNGDGRGDRTAPGLWTNGHFAFWEEYPGTKGYKEGPQELTERALAFLTRMGAATGVPVGTATVPLAPMEIACSDSYRCYGGARVRFTQPQGFDLSTERVVLWIPADQVRHALELAGKVNKALGAAKKAEPVYTLAQEDAWRGVAVQVDGRPVAVLSVLTEPKQDDNSRQDWDNPVWSFRAIEEAVR